MTNRQWTHRRELLFHQVIFTLCYTHSSQWSESHLRWKTFAVQSKGHLKIARLTHWSPGGFGCNFKNSILKLALLICTFRASFDKVIRWITQDLTDHKSTLVQVMAWCHQATSHYLSQCWPRSLSPNGVTRPQWVKIILIFYALNSVMLDAYQYNSHMQTCGIKEKNIMYDWISL